MINENIKTQFFYSGKFHTDGSNINELIDNFEYIGVGEFTYNGTTYYIRRTEQTPNNDYLPGISTDINFNTGLQIFSTWEDLVENFRFPDGKGFLDILFED